MQVPHKKLSAVHCCCLSEHQRVSTCVHPPLNRPLPPPLQVHFTLCGGTIAKLGTEKHHE